MPLPLVILEIWIIIGIVSFACFVAAWGPPPSDKWYDIILYVMLWPVGWWVAFKGNDDK